VQQNQHWSRTRAQVAHAGAIEIHPALFHALARRWSRACHGALHILHLYFTHRFTRRKKSSRAQDNSFLVPRFYLSETTPLTLHLGSFGSPFFFTSPLETVILSGASISRSEMDAQSKDLALA
jgi:hypothetical protein